MLPFFIIILPFIGTTLGSAAVFFCKNNISENLKKLMLAFAAGVMIAAGIWSLLIPSIELSDSRLLSWLPAAAGFGFGILFLKITENIVSKIYNKVNKTIKSTSSDLMLFIAVTLHNIPEGMAVGVACAGMLNKSGGVTAAGAMALSLGIAIQNFPEGAIISLPMNAGGENNFKSFLIGTFSGIVEPIAAIFTVLFVSKIILLLPYLLSFAAGAMFYVTIEDLIPESKNGTESGVCAIVFAAGFLIMMILDVVFG